MSQETKQQLSAFIDGELETSTARFLVRRMANERELVACWERWHLTRDCLQRQRVTPLRDDFAERIAAVLAGEANPQSRAGGSVLRWAGGFAVAASVALAALLIVPTPSGGPAPGAPVAATSAVAAPVAEVVPSGLTERDLRPTLGNVAHTVSATGNAPLSPALQLDPRIETYLLRHDGVLREVGHDSFVPLIPIVSPPRQWTMVPVEAESAR